MDRSMRRGFPAFGAGAIVAVLALLSACASAPDRARIDSATEYRSSNPRALHVGTFNIRMIFPRGESRERWHARRQSVVDLIQAESPQVIGLQEVANHTHGEPVASEQLAFLRAELDSYAFACVGDPKTVASENPILYDPERFELLSEGFFFFSTTPEVIFSVSWGAGDPVYAAWAQLRDQLTGSDLWVFNVHFDHLSGRSKRNAARIVCEYVDSIVPAGGASIVLGDFNAFARSGPLRRIRAEGFTHALPFGTGGSYHMFTGRPPWPRIDHILVSEQLTAIDGYLRPDRSDHGYPSDHFPAFATLAWAGQ